MFIKLKLIGLFIFILVLFILFILSIILIPALIALLVEIIVSRYINNKKKNYVISYIITCIVTAIFYDMIFFRLLGLHFTYDSFGVIYIFLISTLSAVTSTMWLELIFKTNKSSTSKLN